MNLEEEGYNPRNNGKRRRRILERVITESSFDRVFEQMKHLSLKYEGYEQERVEKDLKFLADRQNRYITEKEEYSV